MAYYYISPTGSATGDAGRYTSLQTGTSAAVASYANLTAMLAATTPEVAGDYVLFFDDYTGTDTTFSSLANGINMLAVSALNGSLSRRSGFYPTITFSSVTFDNISVSGFKFALSTNTLFNQTVKHNDCYFDYDLSETAWASSIDGCSITAKNCTIFTAVVGIVCTANRGATIDIDNLTLDATAGNGVSRFTDGGFALGGGSVRCTNSDLATIKDTLIKNVGGNLADDTIDVRFDNCKLAASVAFTNEDFKAYGQRALFTRCADTASAMEYQYHLHAFGGDVDDDTSQFRTQDTAFTLSNQKVSYKIESNSDATLGTPLWFDFPMSSYAALSSTSTMAFYINSSVALTDKDIYITVSYPDGTTYTTNRQVNSAPQTVGGTLDLLATATALATDSSSTWNVVSGNNYQIELDCVSGADCQPMVTVYVTKDLSAASVYLASEYGVS
jgi:hypothetical protein